MVTWAGPRRTRGRLRCSTPASGPFGLRPEPGRRPPWRKRGICLRFDLIWHKSIAVKPRFPGSREAVAAFSARVHELERAGLRVEEAGAWPPYRFTPPLTAPGLAERRPATRESPAGPASRGGGMAAATGRNGGRP